MYNWFWTNHADKAIHFGIGAFIYFVAIGVTKSIVAALVIVLAAAIAKELYDKFIKKTAIDIFDILATLLGGGAAAITFYLLQRWG